MYWFRMHLLNKENWLGLWNVSYKYDNSLLQDVIKVVYNGSKVCVGINGLLNEWHNIV